MGLRSSSSAMKQFKRVLPQLYMRTNGLQTLRFEIIQLSEQSASMTNQIWESLSLNRQIWHR